MKGLVRVDFWGGVINFINGLFILKRRKVVFGEVNCFKLFS